MAAEQTRYSAAFALLRGVVLLLAGIFALVAPATALKVIVIVGGCLLIIDGILVLASQDYGVERTWPFWLSMIRGVLGVVAGILVLSSLYLATVMSPNTLAALVGAQAIIVGVLEVVMIIRERTRQASVWSSLLGAALYVALGVLLLFVPYAGAIVAIRIGGAILAAFAILQVVQTWHTIRNLQGAHPLA